MATYWIIVVSGKNPIFTDHLHTTGHLRVWSYSFRRQGGRKWEKCPVVWTIY